MPFSFQVRRLTSFLQKKLAIQGHIPLSMVEDVTLALALNDGREVEDLHLREEYRYCRAITSAASVGNLSQVRLEVLQPAPGVQPRLVIIEGVDFGSTTGTIRAGWRASTGGGASTPSSPLDGRNFSTAAGGQQQSVLQFQIGTVAASDLATNTPIERPANDVTSWNRLAVVLFPGFMWCFEGQTVNNQVLVNLQWREYGAAPQEARPG